MVDYEIGSYRNSWGLGPDDYPGKDDVAVAHLCDLEASGDETYYFLKHFNNVQDPILDEIYGKYSRLLGLQTLNKRFGISFRDLDGYLDVTMATDGSSNSSKPNEDALLFLPFAANRFLVGVIDGANSQLPINGLERYKVKGSWYVSHLATLGFPMTQDCQNIQSDTESTVRDFVIGLNNFLKTRLSKIEGVNYENTLTVPGAAATFALVDMTRCVVSLAHIADTMAIVENPDGYIILTDNKNEAWDDETIALVKSIQAERGCTLRQAATDQRVKDQLKASFIAKINTPKGCGILNGMPQLFSNGLVQYLETDLNPDTYRLVLASDGFYGPFEKNQNAGTTNFNIRAMLGAVDQASVLNDSLTVMCGEQLEMDPDHELIPRLGFRDDISVVSIAFGGRQTQFQLGNQLLYNLRAS